VYIDKSKLGGDHNKCGSKHLSGLVGWGGTMLFSLTAATSALLEATKIVYQSAGPGGEGA
jgi:hypothetical protein